MTTTRHELHAELAAVVSGLPDSDLRLAVAFARSLLFRPEGPEGPPPDTRRPGVVLPFPGASGRPRAVGGHRGR